MGNLCSPPCPNAAGGNDPARWLALPHLTQPTDMQAFQLVNQEAARVSPDWQEWTEDKTKSAGYWAINVSRVPGTHSSRFQDFKIFCSLNVSVYR